MNTTRQKTLQTLLGRMTCVMRTLKSGKTFPFDGCTLSNTQADILLYISHHKTGVSVKEIAEYFSVTSGAVTQLIDGLVDKKLVTRTEYEEDRRVLVIVLTKHAQDALKKFKNDYYDDLLPMFDGLNAEEISQLNGLLNKIDNSKRKKGGE
jgi:DNA-binding MarR family transcriptional regulator